MIRYHLDQHGYPRAAGDGHDRLLGTFLEQDVQGSQEFCRELLDVLAQVEASTITDWSSTGNAHTISVSPTGVRIENDWSPQEPTEEYARAEVEAAVRHWMQLLASRQS